MDIIEYKLLPVAAHVINTQTLASIAIEEFKKACIESFRRLWYSDISAKEQLEVMGNKAAIAFEQHSKAILFLLSSGVNIDPIDYTPPLQYNINEDGSITLIE